MNVLKLANIAIIYNPQSTGKSKQEAERLRQQLRRRLKIPVVLLGTQYAGHAEELAYDFVMKHSRCLVISASGDGGYHEVVNGVISAQRHGRHAICGVLPTGNANDHRRSIRQQPLVRSILAGSTGRLDLLAVTIRHPDNSQTIRYAHSYAGLGLTPVVASELNRHNLNPLKESWIVLKAFYKFRAFRAEVEDEIQKYDSIICTNIQRMAKVLRIAKGASPHDGRFEVVLFPARPKPMLFLTLLKAVTVGLKTAHLTDHFKLKMVQPMPIQLDGEVYALATGDTVEIIAAPDVLQTIL